MWPNPRFIADLVTFTEEILKGKLHFYAVRYHFKFFKGCLPQILLGPFYFVPNNIFVLTYRSEAIHFIMRCFLKLNELLINNTIRGDSFDSCK